VAYGDGSCLAVKGRPGTYRLKAYDPHTGRQKTKTIYDTPSRRAAQAELAKFKRQPSTIGPTLQPNCTVAEFLDYWIAQKRSNWSPTTYRGYESKLKKVRRDFPHIHLFEIGARLGSPIAFS
jgi:hypothetical protein